MEDLHVLRLFKVVKRTFMQIIHFSGNSDLIPTSLYIKCIITTYLFLLSCYKYMFTLKTNTANHKKKRGNFFFYFTIAILINLINVCCVCVCACVHVYNNLKYKS